MRKTRKNIKVALVLIFIALVVYAILSTVNYYKDMANTGLENTVPYGFGKEAKVILLAGQSNAAGCSRDEYLKQNVSEEQYQKYEDGFDNVYINYFVSGTNESHAFVKCEARQGEYGGFFGPELGLAEKLNEMYPDETFFIIKYAWGGTNLCEQWLSPSSGATGQIYNGFVQFVNASLEYLALKNYDVKIEAMCWMQGESDSIDETSTASYANNLGNFIKDIRAEFSAYASDDGIAFVDAYIADSFFWKYYIRLNEAKQTVADSSSMNVVIDTISAGLSVIGEPIDEPDIAHYDSMSELKLGHLFAEACVKFID